MTEQSPLTTGDLLLRRTVRISEDRIYRYRLERFWSGKHALPFVMLNPSIADADIDDPTIRRCMRFARREGAGGIIVANLYAYRATEPNALWHAPDPYGPDNDAELTSVASWAARAGMPVVCAWGVHGGRNNRPIVLMQHAGARQRGR